MRRSKNIRFLAVLAAFVLAIGSVATPFAHASISPLAIPDFTITGGGYGHGIGLSQYGAQGYAIKGWTYDDIIKHYYKGVSVVKQAATVAPRINLDMNASARNSWTVRAVEATLTAYDSIEAKTFPKNTYYTFTNTAGGVVMKNSSGSTVETFAGAVTVDPVGSARVEFRDPVGPRLNANYPNGYPYMRYRGKVQFTRNGTTSLYAYNTVSLQEYLYGVVPRESPASWNAEALKAQAVVARSYAKAKIDPDDNGTLDANLRCTTADQVYGGYSRLSGGAEVMHEVASTNNAVNATVDLVVKSGSTIVQTFFFSASGGHTANIEDSWSYASPKTYFVGVDDPYETLAGSPHNSWSLKLSGLDIAAKLRASSTVASELSSRGLPAVPGGSTVWVSGVTITRGVSDYPRWVYFHFNDPAKTVCKLSAYTVKSALGLKSPSFSFSGFPMSRIQGATRYDTAVVISRRAFGSTAPAVVIASGEDYPDALTGSALAGAENGALLLTAKASLPTVVEAELKRLNPSRVYIMGSTGAVAAGVEARVRLAVPSAITTRIAGVDRYETARKAADRVFALKGSTKAIVVNGTAWPDAASVSALAYANSYPVLLSKASTLGAHTAGYLSANKPAMTYVVGGLNVVPKSAYDAIPAATGKAVMRLFGADRYASAAAVARQSVSVEGFSAQEVYITTGLNFPDALSSSVLAGVQKRPLLLTHPNSCPNGTAGFLTEKKPVISYIWILGGTGAISQAGLAAIDSVMMN